MPIATCSECGKRPAGRLASIYWSKWSGDGDREAWKQRFDKQHYEQMAADWLDAAHAAFDASGTRVCLLCDATDYAELSELYCTIFVPNSEARRFTIAACLGHMPEVLAKAKRGGEGLPDRTMYPNGGARATGW